MTTENTRFQHSGPDFPDPPTGIKTYRELDKTVGKIATMVLPDQGILGTGELAELRRISPNYPFTSALWRVLLSLELDTTIFGSRQTDYERKWATLLMGMAICSGLHDYHTPLGKALADSGWSELRFAQLMKARGKNLEILIRRLSQYLASKNQKSDWADVRKLLFYQDGEWAEEQRIRISRAYYQALYQSGQ